MRMKVTPKFNVREIMSKTIAKYWVRFEISAFKMGEGLHKYIQSYIFSHRKRTGGTGKLSKAINFYKFHPAGLGAIFWGIGDIAKLQTKAKYWYVINYGKKVTGEQFIPGGGKFVPGYFGGGNPARSSLKGTGTEKFTYASNSNMGMHPGIIRPMHYIEATKHRLDRRFRLLITTLRRAG